MARGIQAEIKQTKPFGSKAEEAHLALMRTADRLNGKGADWLKRFGISPTQFNALRILRGARPRGLPCSEISERMITRDSDTPGCSTGWSVWDWPSAAATGKTGG